jgi:hypothetical protein
MALGFETVYGTPPVSGFRLMPFARATLGAEQPLLESELLGYQFYPRAGNRTAPRVEMAPDDARRGLWRAVG